MTGEEAEAQKGVLYPRSHISRLFGGLVQKCSL